MNASDIVEAAQLISELEALSDDLDIERIAGASALITFRRTTAMLAELKELHARHRQQMRDEIVTKLDAMGVTHVDMHIEAAAVRRKAMEQNAIESQRQYANYIGDLRGRR